MVHLTLLEHDTYQKRKYDLYQDYPINILNILVGCNIGIIFLKISLLNILSLFVITKLLLRIVLAKFVSLSKKRTELFICVVKDETSSILKLSVNL